ncbi:MAG: hypothetical protein KKA05_02705 [Alphaproteobacteria bacterium]|nr:hypothetical protein [Alphaproteobacteria bacterium]
MVPIYKNGLFILLAVLTLLCSSVSTAQAESLIQFTQRIEQAYKQPNRRAALWDLFYTTALDKEGYNILLETVEKLYLLQPPVIVLAETLRPDEELVERQDGFVYFQNVDPNGTVSIMESKNKERVVRQYYARKDGVYYLTATIRQTEALAPRPVPKDNWFSRRDRGQKKSKTEGSAAKPALTP